MTLKRDEARESDRGLYDVAIAALRRYPRTASGVHDPVAAWDEVLEPIDEILTLRQARHLADVRRTQREQNNPDGS